MSDDSAPLFHNAWWLDAVAGNGNWGACEVREGSTLIASLPYVATRRMGFTFLSMPVLTPRLGPWFAPFQGKTSRQLARHRELVDALLSQLPRHSYFMQSFQPEVTNWLPWHWHGFHQTTRYTYVLKNPRTSDVWAGLQENIRREIRKAEARNGIRIRDDLPLASFIALVRKTFERQSLRFPYPVDAIERLDAACGARNQRRMYFAEDAAGRLHAAIYIVWNKVRAYYLLGGGDPELRVSGATSLAMWEAIRSAAPHVEVFDFEGSMLEPVERFFRGFGAEPTPYFQVWRAPDPLVCAALHARQAWRDIRSGRDKT